MHSFWQDLRYGARMLLKNPGFTLVAVITLALGIGANTAIFSVVNGVLLSALPYPQSDQLTMVWLDNRRQGIRDDITSYPNFQDWRNQNKTFQGMAGVRSLNVNLTGAGEPEELRAATVSSNFFQLMGVGPAQGRGFTAEEEQPGKDKVVILSHGLWQRRFGGDPGILNKTISLNGESHTVVGIMPPGFQFPTKAEIWAPLAPNERLRAARGAFWLPVVGRLKSGVTRAQAQADMDVVARQLEQQYPNLAGYGVNVVPLHEQTVGNVRRALLVLLGAVGFVLLIACANVANLLLARAATRQREVAVRAALGASRWRLVRQLLTESVLLSVAGGALGVLLALWGLELLLDLSPANIPRLDNIRLDGRVLGFTVGLSLLTGLIFGLAPALQTSHLELGETLKEGGRTGAGGSRAQRIRSAFIVAEVALTLALLISAGLLIRSFWRLQQVAPGFKTERVLTMKLALPRSKYAEGAKATAFFQQLQERLSTLPGVEAASAVSTILLPKLANSSNFTIENRPPDPREQSLELPFDAVQPNYFQTMSIQLLSGRTFSEQDASDKPRVAIVNETFVKRYFPNEDAVGKRFTFGDGNNNPQWITIVGVVRDTKRQGLDQPIRIESWFPHAQAPSRSMQVVLRTTGDPLALAGAVRDAVWSLDRDLPIPKMETMEQILSESVAQRRLNMLLLAIFAAVALILAAVGIYGVMSYAVTQRTNEIGIRMALGAQMGDVLKLILAQGMKLALIGVGIGLIATIALTRLMSSLLFGVSATDPLTFAAIALLLTVVALLACYLPARRATKVDPMIALRYE
ncbi:MAG: ABC transporter permease [Blastocatellales bacterium]